MLDKFIEAHEKDYELALQEIKNGRKESHWIWYIFPQLKDLGYSYMAKLYGIEDINEARQYLANSILYEHTIELCNELLKLENNDINEIMGYPDDLKLCSSMTLFYLARPDCIEFKQVLDKYYGGNEDVETIKILKNQNLN